MNRAEVTLFYDYRGDPSTILNEIFKHHYLYKMQDGKRYFVMNADTKVMLVDDCDSLTFSVVSEGSREALLHALEFDKVITNLLNKNTDSSDYAEPLVTQRVRRPLVGHVISF